MNICKKSLSVFLALAVFGCFSVSNTYACSRVTYVSEYGKVVIGRNMDWPTPDNATIKVIKRGTKHKSVSKQNPIEWESKYGILGVISGNDKLSFVNSAINEKKLEADVLYLAESKFGETKKDEETLNVEEYLEYLLGNFATVDEVVEFVKDSKIRLQTLDDPNLCMTVHFIFTDKKGNNAIIEYINGEAKVYSQNGKIVMTNDPSYEKMLAIRDYFKEIGIKTNMPGSSLSQARFVYLSGWLEDISDKKQDLFHDKTFEEQTVLSILSLMRGVSTPLGTSSSETNPNNSSTIWRTVIDITNSKFYFDSALSLAPVWIDLDEVNFGKNQIFDAEKNKDAYGDITKKLEVVK